MLITCPTCASAYEIEGARIGAAGRKVRCGGCQESWFVTADDPEGTGRREVELAGPASGTPTQDDVFGDTPIEADILAAPPVRAPKIDHPRDSSEPTEPPVIDVDEIRPRRAKAAGKRPRKATRRKKGAAGRHPLRRVAAVAAALALACIPPAIALRQQVVAALPRTGALYAALRLPVNRTGLTFAEIVSTLGPGPLGPVLEVTGRIANGDSAPRPLPSLLLAIEDESGRELHSWPAEVSTAEIAPGQDVAFATRLPSPPPGARLVRLTFGEAPAAAPRGPAVASR